MDDQIAPCYFFARQVIHILEMQGANRRLSCHNLVLSLAKSAPTIHPSVALAGVRGGCRCILARNAVDMDRKQEETRLDLIQGEDAGSWQRATNLVFVFVVIIVVFVLLHTKTA